MSLGSPSVYPNAVLDCRLACLEGAASGNKRTRSGSADVRDFVRRVEVVEPFPLALTRKLDPTLIGQ